MLNVENLSVKFIRDDIYLFHNISFVLFPGKIHSIAGPNGTGKTVLLKSLTGLLNNTIFDVEGTVEFKNREIFKMTSSEIRQLRKNNIRYVFQDEANAFDPLKKFGYYFKEGIIKEPAKINGVFNKLLLTPPEKFLNSFPYEVSTGQIQRIGFALAVLSNPDILILDEPTSAIDPINANLYKHTLRDYVTNDRCVLLVTHDKMFAEKVSDFTAVLSSKGLSNFEAKNTRVIND